MKSGRQRWLDRADNTLAPSDHCAICGTVILPSGDHLDDHMDRDHVSQPKPMTWKEIDATKKAFARALRGLPPEKPPRAPSYSEQERMEQERLEEMHDKAREGGV
jgi:hypothetical protein